MSLKNFVKYQTLVLVLPFWKINFEVEKCKIVFNTFIAKNDNILHENIKYNDINQRELVKRILSLKHF